MNQLTAVICFIGCAAAAPVSRAHCVAASIIELRRVDDGTAAAAQPAALSRSPPLTKLSFARVWAISPINRALSAIGAPTGCG